MDLGKVNFSLHNYIASFIFKWFGWLENKIDHLYLIVNLKISNSVYCFGDNYFISLVVLVGKFVRILIFGYEILYQDLWTKIYDMKYHIKIYGHIWYGKRTQGNKDTKALNSSLSVWNYDSYLLKSTITGNFPLKMSYKYNHQKTRFSQ